MPKMRSQITLTTDMSLPRKCQVCVKRGDCQKRKVGDAGRRKRLVEECMFYLVEGEV